MIETESQLKPCMVSAPKDAVHACDSKHSCHTSCSNCLLLGDFVFGCCWSFAFDDSQRMLAGVSSCFSKRWDGPIAKRITLYPNPFPSLPLSTPYITRYTSLMPNSLHWRHSIQPITPNDESLLNPRHPTHSTQLIPPKSLHPCHATKFCNSTSLIPPCLASSVFALRHASLAASLDDSFVIRLQKKDSWMSQISNKQLYNFFLCIVMEPLH